VVARRGTGAARGPPCTVRLARDRWAQLDRRGAAVASHSRRHACTCRGRRPSRGVRHLTEGGLADTARCLDAARFLRSAPRTVAIVEPDTIDDWRTGRRLGGCRVTAAGITRLGLAGEAVRFFERLRAAGWVRTPDPRDSPNEASLRFRRGETDCVFSVYGDARLGTEAEFAVNDSVTAGTGELRYQVLVLCMRALPARPRDSGGATPPR
jgi:hypothetical protein